MVSKINAKKGTKNYVKKYVADPKLKKEVLKRFDKLIPYKDYYPIKEFSTKSKAPTTKTLQEMMVEDSPFKHWDDLGEMARQLYDTKEEALKILTKGSKLFKLTGEETYLLCYLIENTRKKMELKNKDIALRAVIESVFDQCCTYIKQDFTRVNPSRRQLNKMGKKENPALLSREGVIDAIVMKHTRLVKNKPRDFKAWVNKIETNKNWKVIKSFSFDTKGNVIKHTKTKRTK